MLYNFSNPEMIRWIPEEHNDAHAVGLFVLVSKTG